MSVVQDHIDCPRCAKRGFYEFNCRSREEFFQCFFCGYQFETEIEEINSEKEPPYIWHKHEIKGIGSYGIKFKTGNIQFGANRPENTLAEFMEILKDPDVDPDGCYLTKYDEESKRIEYLIGSPEKCFGII